MDTSLTPDEERKLLDAIPQNPEAFRTLYRHYFRRVYAYVLYRVKEHQDAEDITANIFMRVVKQLDRFEYRGAGSFAAWLFRIAQHCVADYYRQRPDTTLIDLTEAAPIPASNPTPDQIFLQKERFERLYHAIKTLSPRRQEVILLRFFAGLRNKEIGEVLGLDERTIASHLCRALEDLQQHYQPISEEELS